MMGDDLDFEPTRGPVRVNGVRLRTLDGAESHHIGPDADLRQINPRLPPRDDRPAEPRRQPDRPAEPRGRRDEQRRPHVRESSFGDDDQFLGGMLDSGFDGRDVRKPSGLDPLYGIRGYSAELGVTLIVLSSFFWLVGSVFSYEGAVKGLNWAMSWLGIPFSIPLGRGVVSTFLAIALGVVISRGQIAKFPFAMVMKGGKRALKLVSGWVLVAWMVHSGINIITNLIGLAALPENPAPLHVWMATNPLIIGFAGLVLAFAPEVLLVVGWALTGWRLPAWRIRGKGGKKLR